MQIADLHIHSHYSRATSKDMTIEMLAKNAKIKGIDILGTGDFTHPAWLKEMKQKLSFENGIYEFDNTKFILSGEISLIYSKNGKGRRVHHVLLAPDFSVVDQINEYLGKKGRLDYDGRPIFGIDSEEFAENMMSISKDIEIIPAHCLLPGTFIHTNLGMKRIEEINEKDTVFTHTGKFKEVTKILNRKYKGKVYGVVPWYFREGLITTPEHPFLAIKSIKKCSWNKGTCKPLCSQKNFCKNKLYKNYKPVWIQAKNLEKGDFLLYPRIKEKRDVDEIKISDFVNSKKTKDEKIVSLTSKNKRNPIENNVKIDKNFCLLAGYYLSEGYVIGDEAIAFSFNANEKEYIDEIKFLMNTVFGIHNFKIDNRRENQADIIFYSKILNQFVKKVFYSENFRAWNKNVPEWMIFLPKEKLAEILRGWWRGDFGYTVSRELTNKMKMICLNLGIIPSISIDTAEKFNKRGNHFILGRKIITQRDTFIFSNLSFFEEDYSLLNEKCFKKFINKRKMKHGWIDNDYAYLPIRKIKIQDFEGEVYNLEVEEDNSYVTEFATVHNCWTPWFAIFGSMSGFDSVEECFGDKAKYIHALETGMSSDPAMNWRLSKLDKYVLVSNSDSHSPYPWRIGREANAFDLKHVDYKSLIDAIRTRNNFLFTIEVDPNYGKYHFDGHRNCNFSCSPQEAKKLNNICPVCKKQLTIGVMHRVEELADRPDGFRPKDAIDFKSLLPLSELISVCMGYQPFSKKVQETHNLLIDRFGSELNILLNTERNELKKIVSEKIADIIIKNRNGKIKVTPGYDGVYGKLVLEKEGEKEIGLKKFMK